MKIQQIIEKDILTCVDCPYCKMKEDTSCCFDSFDDPNYEYYCRYPKILKNNENGKRISVELSKFTNPIIPNWCPFNI